MQEQMLAIPIPMLLALGFLIGFVVFVLGYREESDIARRQHLMGLGIAIIGIMIPITPASWYGYLIVTTGLVLGLIEIVIIAASLIIGVIILYMGWKTYTKSQ